MFILEINLFFILHNFVPTKSILYYFVTALFR